MDQKFEGLIQGVINTGFGMTNTFLDPPLLSDLSDHVNYLFEEGELEEAGIGKSFLHEKTTEIRSDYTKWLSRASDVQLESDYLTMLDDFKNYLNRTCFTALKGHEAMFAAYPKGSYYLKHCDQFKLDMSRQYTLVLYLTKNWQDGDGGELKIWTEDGKVHTIKPKLGHAVFFPSQLEHEVLKTNKRRLSITSWFKTIMAQ